MPEKVERAVTAEEVSASALWPAFAEPPPKRKSSTKVTPRGAKQSMPSPGVPVVTTQRKRPREQDPRTPVLQEVAFDASSDDESVEHPLNARRTMPGPADRATMPYPPASRSLAPMASEAKSPGSSGAPKSAKARGSARPMAMTSLRADFHQMTT